ncbi:hypothetical protein J6590_066723 [Homalodisca vitripennis]|nr:hypothetical protein J6590_066723 [Homalodisca vitripennis]
MSVGQCVARWLTAASATAGQHSQSVCLTCIKHSGSLCELLSTQLCLESCITTNYELEVAGTTYGFAPFVTLLISREMAVPMKTLDELKLQLSHADGVENNITNDEDALRMAGEIGNALLEEIKCLKADKVQLNFRYLTLVEEVEILQSDNDTLHKREKQLLQMLNERDIQIEKIKEEKTTLRKFYVDHDCEQIKEIREQEVTIRCLQQKVRILEDSKVAYVEDKQMIVTTECRNTPMDIEVKDTSRSLEMLCPSKLKEFYVNNIEEFLNKNKISTPSSLQITGIRVEETQDQEIRDNGTHNQVRQNQELTQCSKRKTEGPVSLQSFEITETSSSNGQPEHPMNIDETSHNFLEEGHKTKNKMKKLSGYKRHFMNSNRIHWRI